MNCKYCRSEDIIKFGKVKGIQRYFCKSCRRKFVSPDTIPKMQTSTSTISKVLNLYHQGLSENEIRRMLIESDNICVSTGSIFSWVRRFTDLAIRETVSYVPEVSTEWVADETLLNLVGKSVCFWDIIDKGSCLLITSHMSLTRTALDAQELINQAYERTDVIPRVICTDKLAPFLVSTELNFGEEIKREQDGLFNIENGTSLVARVHTIFRERTRIMHRLRNLDTIRRFMESWSFYYNYLKPHPFLSGKTPAELAGINFPFKNWQDIIEQPYTETTRIP